MKYVPGTLVRSQVGDYVVLHAAKVNKENHIVGLRESTKLKIGKGTVGMCIAVIDRVRGDREEQHHVMYVVFPHSIGWMQDWTIETIDV